MNLGFIYSKISENLNGMGREIQVSVFSFKFYYFIIECKLTLFSQLSG